MRAVGKLARLERAFGIDIGRNLTGLAVIVDVHRQAYGKEAAREAAMKYVKYFGLDESQRQELLEAAEEQSE